MTDTATPPKFMLETIEDAYSVSIINLDEDSAKDCLENQFVQKNKDGLLKTVVFIDNTDIAKTDFSKIDMLYVILPSSQSYQRLSECREVFSKAGIVFLMVPSHADWATLNEPDNNLPDKFTLYPVSADTKRDITNINVNNDLLNFISFHAEAMLKMLSLFGFINIDFHDLITVHSAGDIGYLDCIDIDNVQSNIQTIKQEVQTKLAKNHNDNLLEFEILESGILVAVVHHSNNEPTLTEYTAINDAVVSCLSLNEAHIFYGNIQDDTLTNKRVYIFTIYKRAWKYHDKIR